MFNVVSSLAPSFLIGSSSFLQITRSAIKSWVGLNLDKIGSGPAESAALERLGKLSYIYNERNVVTTLAPSFLN